MTSSQDRADAARQALAAIEEAKRTQPERLAQMRGRADDERIKALVAEPWVDCLITVPTVDIASGECNGMMSIPSIDGKELFGTRLAFDLLGCCGGEEQVAAKLSDFYLMLSKPEDMFLVCAAALKVIANDVMPTLLDRYEAASGDYDTRVLLADAARNAWSVRLVASADGQDVGQ